MHLYYLPVEDIVGSMPGKDEVTELKEEIKSFLTERQMQVLRLRLQDFSQQEVAKMMGTTRANISKLEQRAHQNIIASRRTIHDWMKVQAPIISQIPAGTDVLRMPDMIFREADLVGIHLPANSLDLIVRLKAKAPFLFKRQRLPRDVVIFITREGQILWIDEAVK
ncbi:MAG: Tfx family DNA-binding protein [Methanothrix sp.]|nr:Tfx family DNA-binding protein [Methanothrix sp.]